MAEKLDSKEDVKSTVEEWAEIYHKEGSQKATAQLAAKFMIGMSYYHDRMKLHIMLHPLFYLAGFLTAYFLMGE